MDNRLFRTGDRVRIHPLYQETDPMPWYQITCEGVIECIEPITIMWDNGECHAYTDFDCLVHVDEPIRIDEDATREAACDLRGEILRVVEDTTIQDAIPSTDLPIGTRVKPNPDHPDYHTYKSQHKDNEGTIVEDYVIGDVWIKVRWDYGYTNSYRKAMLIPIEKTPPPPLYLPGTKVNVKRKVYFGNNDMYIINIIISEDQLRNWNRYGSKFTTVRIGARKRSEIIEFSYRNIIPVDAPPAKIDFLEISGIGRIYVIDDDKDMWNRINEHIINHNGKVISHHIYDDAWRDSIMRANETHQQ